MQPLSSRRCGVVLLGFVVAFGVSACSKGIRKITVNGTVSYKGQKLSSGLLQFVGENGAYSASSIQPDGKYIMTDVVPGETKIGIMQTPESSGSSGGDTRPGSPKLPPVNLPEKFRNAETSGVKYTITADTRELHVELK